MLRENSHPDFPKNESVQLVRWKMVFETPFQGFGEETDNHPRKHNFRY